MPINEGNSSGLCPSVCVAWPLFLTFLGMTMLLQTLSMPLITLVDLTIWVADKFYFSALSETNIRAFVQSLYVLKWKIDDVGLLKETAVRGPGQPLRSVCMHGKRLYKPVCGSS